MAAVLGPEATPRARLSHGHVKSASISAGSGNSQSTVTNREAAASASAAERERDSQRWRPAALQHCSGDPHHPPHCMT